MRTRRRVTRQPTGQPSRTAKPATDLRARVTTAVWLLMRPRSSRAFSSVFLSRAALPSPMLRTIFSSRGAAIGLASPSSAIRAGRISSR